MRGNLSLFAAMLLLSGFAVADNVTLDGCVDNEPPTIFGLLPANNSYTNNSQPLIQAQYNDTPACSGINTSTVQILVDSVNVTASSNVTNTSVSYTPATSLSDGPHNVEVSVADLATNVATAVWSFIVDTIAPTVTWNPLNGVGGLNGTRSDTAPNKDIIMTFSENVTVIDARVDGTPVTLSGSGASRTYTTTETLDAPHNLTITVQDLAGNPLSSWYSYKILPQTRASVVPNPSVSFGVMKNGQSKTLTNVINATDTGYGNVAVSISNIDDGNGGQNSATAFYKANTLWSDGVGWSAWNAFSTTITQNATFNAQKQISVQLNIPPSNTLQGNIAAVAWFVSLPA